MGKAGLLNVGRLPCHLPVFRPNANRPSAIPIVLSIVNSAISATAKSPENDIGCFISHRRFLVF